LIKKGELSEESPFECVGGGNTDGTQYSIVIGGLLLASPLA
jgi:hypothetical protein